MGEAKRRGTFQQRRQQKISTQYGLTNHELAEAYLMNRAYDIAKRREKSDLSLRALLNLLGDNTFPYYI